MPRSEIAIVIPAFKNDFLEQTLDSFAKQTDLNFNLYIGDDNSPNDILGTVKKFEGKLRIVYKKFEENLGGKSLVQQWQRCINLVGNEEWIWLFSDDDLADTNCVEKLYQSMYATHFDFDIYRLSVGIIDEKSRLLRHNVVCQQEGRVTSETFVSNKMNFRLDSFACEYIFRKKRLTEIGGFVEFPLAWCSDDATWALMAKNTGIWQISDAMVLWRFSGKNLSSDYSRNYKEKTEAILAYFKWQKENLEKDTISTKTQIYFLFENAKQYQKPFILCDFFYLYSISSEIAGNNRRYIIKLLLTNMVFNWKLKAKKWIRDSFFHNSTL